MQLVIQTPYLKALQLFAGKKDLRFYLNGVCFQVEKGRAFALATDGHRLAAHLLTEGLKPELRLSVVVPNDIIDAALKIAGKTKQITLEVDETGQSRALNLAGVGGLALDGNFPDWRRVFNSNDGQPEAISYFNPDYLRDVFKAAKLIGSKFGHMKQSGDSAGRATLAHDFDCLVMPFRLAKVEHLPACSWVVAA